jgi:nucleoside-diphosphate-sugar epimerase
MNYYISGADGFIGKHLCKYLEGNFIYKIKRNDPTGLEFVLDSYPPDIVIHLAAYGNHYHQKGVNETIKANVFFLESMIKIFKGTGMKKFYNISTSSVTLPVQTYYSLTKKIGEKLIEAEDERFVNVRPYSVYGEFEAEHRFIPTVIRCLESGEGMDIDEFMWHDWIFINDFIKAMFEGVTEIGSGGAASNIEIVEILEKISGKKLTYIPKEGMRNYDNQIWECKEKTETNLYDGLKKVYEFRTKNIGAIKEV